MSAPYRTDYDWTGVVNPMTDDEAREWIAALRSGEYAQASLALEVDGVGLCRLGVERVIHHVPSNSDGTLCADGDEMEGFLRLPEKLQRTLYCLNDNGHTFAQIADEIERGFGQTEASQ